jgi:Domain of unknown function (DUF4604)
MPPKEPTKHQLSARLQFQSQTPAFLRAFQNRISGRRVDEDEDAPQIEGDDGSGGRGDDAVDEFGRSVSRPQLDEFGREVRRAGSVEREKEAKSEKMRRREMDEEEDEKPVVVVLKEGKHLTEFEAENERRKGTYLSPVTYLIPTNPWIPVAKGLDPLPPPDAEPLTNTPNRVQADQAPSSSKSNPAPAKSKSGVQIGKAAGSKRKARVVADEPDDDQGPIKRQRTEEKKRKKAGKNLLSFGDEP